MSMRCRANVQLGLHFCYGSYGGRHWMEPKDTANCVEVHNRVVDRIAARCSGFTCRYPSSGMTRRYFAPLAALKRRPETEALSRPHPSAGRRGRGATDRIAAAEKFVADFGIATECGFGRRPPETIPDLLKLHAAIFKLRPKLARGRASRRARIIAVYTKHDVEETKHETGRIHMRRRLLAAMLACGLGLFAVFSLAAHADNDMFKGRTIIVYVSTGPGGGYDAYGRLVARHIGRHLPAIRM